MSRLPLEVIHLCVYHLDNDRDDINDISYTCHRLRDFCLPILFKSVTFTVLCSSPDLFLQKKTAHLKALAAHATIPTLVQSFDFVANDLARITEHKAHSPSTFSDYLVALIMAVQNFVNISHLALQCPDLIGPAMLNLFYFLPSLPRLVNLKLSIRPFKPLEIDPPLLLRELVLEDPIVISALAVVRDRDNCHTISIFSLSHIEKLTSRSIRHSQALFKTIKQQDGDCQLTNLTVLKLDVLELFFQDLLDFLTFCPNLRQLWIIRTTNGIIVHPPLSINATALQNLEEFMGPLVLAELIVPGRPIHTVHANDHLRTLEHDPEFDAAFSVEDLKFLGESSADITTLSFSLRERLAGQCLMGFISSFFPRLRSLELVVEVSSNLRQIPPDLTVADKDRPVNNMGLPLVEPVDEADKLGTQTYVQNFLESVEHGYETLIYGVALGKYALPTKIERLKIRLAHFESEAPGEDASNTMFFEPFSFSMMRRIIDALSTRYADLASVKLGYHTEKWRLGWEKREGGDWMVVEMPVDNVRPY
ncbi:hypothetical protein CPB83DRAFT_880456 [Crepidotus variabilis]|uniref:Uncharacterized protein n=1 Tax=Crepidotus variabilis TaxID=179855 RepID=A0A9P6JUF5_9AGAR|nr:hypothetical protein CPB83DRAFT_880456 [Crepidotus variabilis]